MVGTRVIANDAGFSLIAWQGISTRPLFRPTTNGWAYPTPLLTATCIHKDHSSSRSLSVDLVKSKWRTENFFIVSLCIYWCLSLFRSVKDVELNSVIVLQWILAQVKTVIYVKMARIQWRKTNRRQALEHHGHSCLLVFHKVGSGWCKSW